MIKLINAFLNSGKRDKVKKVVQGFHEELALFLTWLDERDQADEDLDPRERAILTSGQEYAEAFAEFM